MDRKPTDILEKEHRLIQQAVAAMGALADALEASQIVRSQTLLDIVEFMRTFADKCHHGKEEDLLFPLLVARGVPTQGCPIGALTYEHQQGRALVGEFAEAVAGYAQDATAAEPVVKGLRALIDLYPGHIWKEDYLLFPMTNKVLSESDQDSLYAGFQAVDEALGAGVHRRFEEMVARLETEVLTVRAPHTR